MSIINEHFVEEDDDIVQFIPTKEDDDRTGRQATARA